MNELYSTSLDYVDFSYYPVTLAIFSLCIICGVPILDTRLGTCPTFTSRAPCNLCNGFNLSHAEVWVLGIVGPLVGDDVAANVAAVVCHGLGL